MNTDDMRNEIGRLVRENAELRRDIATDRMAALRDEAYADRRIAERSLQIHAECVEVAETVLRRAEEERDEAYGKGFEQCRRRAVDAEAALDRVRELCDKLAANRGGWDADIAADFRAAIVGPATPEETGR